MRILAVMYLQEILSWSQQLGISLTQSRVSENQSIISMSLFRINVSDIISE